MKSRAQFEILFVGLTLTATVAGVFGWHLMGLTAAQKTQNDLFAQTLERQQADIEQSQIEIAALLTANNTVAEELKTESAKRLAAEQANRATAAQLEQTIEKNKAPNTSAIISQWRPRIAMVNCEWAPQNNKRATKLGTAVLMPNTGSASAQLLTSKHVLTYFDKLPETCTLTFPDQDEKIQITSSNITLSQTKYDWAKITLSNPPAYATALALTSALRCSNAPVTGDGVIILGYPKIGAKGDITATEGIISGIDDKYYITSAKVERGNSGGAAILTKQNCYLGIPTFVDAGEIESLARILDQHVID